MERRERRLAQEAKAVTREEVLKKAFEGRITYIGGHAFLTTVPYSTNASAPFLRAFYNSLLFNGAGEAKLDLSLESDTYPQNGTGPLNLSIKNIGGATANNIASVGVTQVPLRARCA